MPIVDSAQSHAAVVICRGQSLSGLKHLSNDMVSIGVAYDLYFVNRFRELLLEPSAVELANSAKKVSQYINNEIINLESLETYKKLHVSEIQSNKKKIDPDRPDFIREGLLGAEIDMTFIPNSTSAERYKLISSGLGCAAFCTTKKKYDQIFVIGLDFFETDYFHYHVHTNEKSVKEYQPEKGKKAKLQFLQLVEHTPDVNFKLYTKSNVQCPVHIQNLTVRSV